MSENTKHRSPTGPAVSSQTERALVDDAVAVLRDHVTLHENRIKQGRAANGVEEMAAEAQKFADQKKDIGEHPAGYLPIGGWTDGKDISKMTDAQEIGSAIVKQCVSGDQFLARGAEGTPEIWQIHPDKSGRRSVIEEYKLTSSEYGDILRNLAYEVKDVGIDQTCNGIVSSLAKPPQPKKPREK